MTNIGCYWTRCPDADVTASTAANADWAAEAHRVSFHHSWSNITAASIGSVADLPVPTCAICRSHYGRSAEGILTTLPLGSCNRRDERPADKRVAFNATKGPQ